MRSALHVAAIALVAFVLYRGTLGLGMHGDSYTILYASAVHEVGDLPRVVSQQFMADRFGDDFYRPVLNLTFALDHALWGLDPFGFQLTQLLSLVVAAAALYALLGRLLPEAPRAVALGAALLFVLHPIHWEGIPVGSRRHEYLCGAFLALGLRATLGPRVLSGERWGWAAALFTLLAVGVKESGAIAVPLLALCGFLAAPAGSPAGRLRVAVRASVPSAVVVALMAAARTAVLGPSLGAQDGSLFDVGYVANLVHQTLLPHAELGDSAMGAALPAAVALGGALALAIGLREGDPDEAASASTWRTIGCALAIGTAWAVMCSMLVAFVGRPALRPWHELLPAMGLAIAFAGCFAGALARWRGAGAGTRAAVVAAHVPLLVWAGVSLSFSEPFTEYEQWRRAAADQRAYLERLESRVERAEDGRVLRLAEVPIRADHGGVGPEVRAPVLAPAPLASFVRLRWPHRKIWLVSTNLAGATVPDGLVLVVDMGVLPAYLPAYDLRAAIARLAPRSPALAAMDARHDDRGRSLLDDVALAEVLDVLEGTEGLRAETYLLAADVAELLGSRPLVERALAAARALAPDDGGIRARLAAHRLL